MSIIKDILNINIRIISSLFQLDDTPKLTSTSEDIPQQKAVSDIQKQPLKYIKLKTHNPKQIDLTLKKIFSGGYSSIVINEICNTTNSKIISDDGTVEFIFNDAKNISLEENKCNYFKAGSFTAVYVVRKPNDNVDLILRITTIEENILFDIKTYNDNIKIGIKNNLPDYLYCGILTVNNKKYNYSIVKTYKVISDFVYETLANRKLFFKKLLELLAMLENKNYFINDFKPDNIGYDDTFNPIIIDYDAKTITREREGPQTFWCNVTKYPGTKLMIDGFVAFIFALFFNDPFWDEPWNVNGCHSMYICGIIEAKKNLHKNPEVDQEYFDFLKDLIITNSTKGLLSNNPPTFNEVLNIYNGAGY